MSQTIEVVGELDYIYTYLFLFIHIYGYMIYTTSTYVLRHAKE